MKDKGFFNIFYCHPPGFCAIKEKLQLRLGLGINPAPPADGKTT
jgi:hypothetical protein